MDRVTCPRCQYRFFPYEGRMVGGCPRCGYPVTALDRSWTPWQAGQLSREKSKWLIQREVDRAWSYFKAGLLPVLIIISTCIAIILAIYLAATTMIRFGAPAIIFWAIVAIIVASIWVGSKRD